MPEVDGEKILMAIEELNRWKEREKNLSTLVESLPKGERTTRLQELSKVKEQVAYYDALVRDMKKEVNPPKLNDFMEVL